MVEVERKGGTSTLQYNINISSGEASPLLEECDRWGEIEGDRIKGREGERGRENDRQTEG